jgi:hypothetical protein
MIYASLGDTDQAMTGWATKSDLTRVFCCGRASILSAPTRAFKTLCTALAYPVRSAFLVPVPNLQVLRRIRRKN